MQCNLFGAVYPKNNDGSGAGTDESEAKNDGNETCENPGSLRLYSNKIAPRPLLLHDRIAIPLRRPFHTPYQTERQSARPFYEL